MSNNIMWTFDQEALPAKKVTLYLDADDTVMQSSAAVVGILNEKYGISPKKTVEDVRDYDYRSIWKGLTKEEKRNIFESEEFYDKVELFPEFIEFYENGLEKFNFVVVTRGTVRNLEMKYEYLKKALGGEVNYIGLPVIYDEDGKELKSYHKYSINMRHGIQVDDEVKEFDKVNSPVKILLKTFGDRTWNNRGYENVPNFYVTNNWNEAIEIMEFAHREHYIFKKCN